jgi:hypothetical protein
MSKFKIGDRVRRVAGGSPALDVGTEHIVSAVIGNSELMIEGRSQTWSQDYFELVSAAGPVRERVVKEIVRGKYGRLNTLEIAPNGVNSRSAAVALETRFYTQADLREIAGLISATADALDEVA